MEKSIVNIPVKVHIWIREDCQLAQYEVIKKARPSVLFIQSDGGRNPEEWKAINCGRKLYEQLDWECNVYRIYSDVNLGMYTMGQKADDIIWSHVDRCVFLEDDCIPSVSFFTFCEVLLEKYKDDDRIEMICGMNSLGVCEEVSSDYFFSKGGSIWGFATWKRVYDGFDKEKKYSKDDYVLRCLKQATQKDNPKFCQQLIGYSQEEKYDGHIPWYEFYMALDLYANNRLNIVPKYNMISCWGCTDNASHSSSIALLPHSLRQLFMSNVYEITFPLIDPAFFVEDKFFQNEINSILQGKNGFERLFRKLEVVFLHIRAGSFFNWVKKKIGKKNET